MRDHSVRCIHKSLVIYAVMFLVYNPGLLNDNKDYIQSLCLSWLRLSIPGLTLGTPVTAIPGRESKRRECPGQRLQ